MSLRSRWIVLAALAGALSGCDRDFGRKRTPVAIEVVAVGPVTLEQATRFADTWVAAALPCDEERIGDLFDHEALAAKLLSDIDLPAAHERGIRREMVRLEQGAELVCAWEQHAETLRVLRVRPVDGRVRPVLRRSQTSPLTETMAVTYEELELGVSPGDHEVRVIDVYSYGTGQWMSDSLAESLATTGSLGMADAMTTSQQVLKANQLLAAGAPGEALAIIDALPEVVRRTRTLQMMRVAIAEELSSEAYDDAVAQLVAMFPDDPSIASVGIDAALVARDFDAALRFIDLIDHAIGGDPWNDMMRANVYLQRKQPGDVDRAAARAEAATTAEPTLEEGWWSRLEVELARKRWPAALQMMDELERRFDTEFEDELIRASELYAGLAKTPEYAAWIAAHQE